MPPRRTDPAPTTGPDGSNPVTPALRALVEALAAVATQRPVDLPAARALTEASVLLGQLEALHAVVLDRIAPHIGVTVSLEALSGAPGTLGPVAASGSVLPRSLVRGGPATALSPGSCSAWAARSSRPATPNAR